MKVAILLSTYNGERFLRDQLESLLSQSHNNISIRVRDDGSVDDTVKILEEYASKHPEIEFRCGTNIGVVGSYIDLLRGAEGDFDCFAFCDQDDVWLPGKIEAAVSMLTREDDSQPLLYCSRVEFVKEDLTHLGFNRIPKRIGFGNAVVENIAIGCTIVMNRKARELILSKIPTFIIMHDWWFHLVVSAFGKILWDKKSYIKYRQHGENILGGSKGLVVNRARILLESGKKWFRVREQAAEFMRCYGSMLDSDKSWETRRFVDSGNNFFARLNYSFTKGVWRQAAFDDFMLRCMILMGYY
jgi:glycosyltransferase involved in cell wall biosynthesis